VRIAVGADDEGALPGAVVSRLRELGHDVLVRQTREYVDVAEEVARDVTEGRADEGVVMCWTGTGVSIAANKIPGVRAALCGDAETARGARRWNHANVLALSMRTTNEALAREILDAWLTEPFGAEEFDRRSVAKLVALDGSRP
jgi:ribose 5-phosphate isomerase B